MVCLLFVFDTLFRQIAAFEMTCSHRAAGTVAIHQTAVP